MYDATMHYINRIATKKVMNKPSWQVNDKPRHFSNTYTYTYNKI